MKKAALIQPRRREFVVPCGRYRLRLGRRTLIMGILNLTPDSFSDGGRYNALDMALARAEEMLKEGADVLDLGGESTRPGARRVTVKEELMRILPLLKKLVRRANVPISIDTYKSAVARQCLEEGASLINDVTALRGDPQMADVIRDFSAPVILMHMKGTPLTMQKNPRYSNLFLDIKTSLKESIRLALKSGISRSRILIDPGIGFGKTVRHNLSLIKGLEFFARLGFPVVIGISRKSFIGKVLGLPVEERIWGTASSAAIAAWNGAHIVRVHDVKEMKQVTEMADAILSAAVAE